MDNLISLYQERFNLHDATLTHIDHDDAMVAIVYNVTLLDGTQLILKICTRTKDYLRELYFLKHFANILPVPRILQTIPPEPDNKGAILMGYLPGVPLKITDFTRELAYETGQVLARIHLNRTTAYGDLTRPNDLTQDPRVYFTKKFEENFAECTSILSSGLLEQCRTYYSFHLDLLTSVDGPCMVYRDFRPGNMIGHHGKLEGIIDWAAAGSGFAEEDFTAMEHKEWIIDSSNRASFLAGYESIRQVPDYEAMMPLLRLCKALGTIGFICKSGKWDESRIHLYEFNLAFLKALLTNF